jgi:RimJ/RimL family protein N-acetyltransferase
MERALVAPVIRTKRLTLRAHRPDDAAAWHVIVNDPRSRQFLHWPVRDKHQSHLHLEHRTRHTKLWQADDFLALAIELDGMLIGDVSMHLRSTDGPTRSAEIGWLLDSRYSGNGYATEATAAMLALAFEVLEAQWVTAIIVKGNERSVALARRLGFLPVAEARGHNSYLMPGLTWDERGKEIQRRFGIKLAEAEAEFPSASPLRPLAAKLH